VAEYREVLTAKTAGGANASFRSTAVCGLKISLSSPKIEFSHRERQMTDTPAKSKRSKQRVTRPSRTPNPQQVKKAPPKAGPAKVSGNRDSTKVYHGAEAVAALVVSAQAQARTKTKIILVLMAVLSLSLIWNTIQSATRPEPKLLAVTNDGRVQPLPLLDAPIDNRATIVDWARRNLPKLYDFNYVNYQAALNKNLDFTGKKTNESFISMLNSAGILSKVVDEFLIMRATIAAEPIITKEMVVGGTRVWVVETPMNLIYDSGEVRDNQRRQIEQPIVFKAWIARASPVQYEGGLMLAKFEVLPRHGNL